MTYPCPSCHNRTLSEQPPGTYEICPVCFWEDDPVQFEDKDYDGGKGKGGEKGTGPMMENEEKRGREHACSARGLQCEFSRGVRLVQVA